MAAATLDIEVEQGTKFKKKLIFKDSNNVVIDISTYTFKAQIRKKYSDSKVLAEMDFDFVTDGTDGELMMTIDPDVTSAIPVLPAKDYKRPDTNYIWDLEVTYAPDDIDRVLEGTAVISPEVTKE